MKSFLNLLIATLFVRACASPLYCGDILLTLALPDLAAEAVLGGCGAPLARALRAQVASLASLTPASVLLTAAATEVQPPLAADAWDGWAPSVAEGGAEILALASGAYTLALPGAAALLVTANSDADWVCAAARRVADAPLDPANVFVLRATQTGNTTVLAARVRAPAACRSSRRSALVAGIALQSALAARFAGREAAARPTLVFRASVVNVSLAPANEIPLEVSRAGTPAAAAPLLWIAAALCTAALTTAAGALRCQRTRGRGAAAAKGAAAARPALSAWRASVRRLDAAQRAAEREARRAATELDLDAALGDGGARSSGSSSSVIVVRVLSDGGGGGGRTGARSAAQPLRGSGRGRGRGSGSGAGSGTGGGSSAAQLVVRTLLAPEPRRRDAGSAAALPADIDAAGLSASSHARRRALLRGETEAAAAAAVAAAVRPPMWREEQARRRRYVVGLSI